MSTSKNTPIVPLMRGNKGEELENYEFFEVPLW
jgi:hypothetical protein